MNNSQVWINTGYELFAREGQDGIQVERLARLLGLNKSGFYHYFGNWEVYYKHLMQHHRTMVDLLIYDIQQIDQFGTDYFFVLIKHSDTIMANKQLIRNSHVNLFEQIFNEVTLKIDRATLTIWADYINKPNHPELAFRYLLIIRDLFYSRISHSRLNVSYLDTLFSNAKNFLEEVSQLETAVLTLTDQ